MADARPSREQMLADLGEAPAPASRPSREQMLADLGEAPSTSLWQKTKSAAGAGLDYGLRGLDYAGGLTRTGVAAAVSPFTPSGEVVDGPTVMNALKGKAPNSAEYMDRMGVPKGASVDLPLVGNVSARGVGGFIGDVALDPLTYATLGAEPAAKAAAAAGLKEIAAPAAKTGFVDAVRNLGSKAVDAGTYAVEKARSALGAGGSAVESAGDSLYKSGFKTVDAKLAQKGVDPLSEVMLNNGRPWGTAATMSDAVDKLTAQKLAARQAVYDAVNAKGAKVDLIKAMEPAVDQGRDILRVDPNAGAQVAGMEDWLLNYGRDGQHIPINQASDFKTRLYKSTLPANAYDPLGRALPVAADMKQQFARGLKEQIEQAAEKAVPGTGSQITGLNQDMGVLLAAQKKALPTEVLKSATKNGFTSMDGVTAGLAAHHPATAIPMLAFKKAADGFNTTAGRTGVGNLMSALGRSGVVDPALRRTLIDMNQDAPSPWAKMKEKK